jgi:SMI1-KNR4 cell-wall
MLDSFKNTWNRCLPLSPEEVRKVEEALAVKMPKALVAFYLKFNGGKPSNGYFTNGSIEVELGAILPIAAPVKFKGQRFETENARLQKTLFGKKLFAFATDTGNAGLFCMDIKAGTILYVIEHEPEDPFKVVAPSLEAFLRKLEEPPY